MNNLKGLLLKDLLVFKGYKKNVIISTITFIILLFIASTRYDMLLYGPLIFLMFYGMSSISTFSYDENDSTDSYLLSLTVSKKEIIKAKYLFVFLDAFLSLSIGIVITLLIYLILGNNLNSLNESIKSWLLAFSGVTFLMCSEIPCIYKWGVEKGRMQSLLVPVIIVTLLGLIFSIIVYIFPVLFQKKYLEFIISKTITILIIVNIIIYYISYLITRYIFEKKDV